MLINIFNILSCLILIHNVTGSVEYLRIGGLFERDDTLRKNAFEYIIEAINEDENLLKNKKMVAMSREYTAGDSFGVAREVCSLLGHGAIAIVGPASATESNYVRSVCEIKDVPHIETRIDSHSRKGECHMNFHPDYRALELAYIDVLKAWDWKRFTILYENSDNLVRISELLKLYDSNDYIITVRQLDLGVGNNYRPIFQLLKAAEEKNFLIDCSFDILFDVLLQAQQVGLMSDEHGYIITNLDMHTLDLEPFQYGGANITGFRLIDPKNSEVIEMTNFWNEMEAKNGNSESEALQPDKFRTEAALIIDAIYAFAKVLADLNYSNFTSHVFDCNDNFGWNHGSTITNFLKMKHVKGLTNDINFEPNGSRNNFTLDLIKLQDGGISKIGTWNVHNKLSIADSSTVNQLPFDEGVLLNRTFIVLTALSAPYGMLKDSTQTLEGNDRYEGFGIELIHEISKMLGFNYTFQIQDDGNYGSLSKVTGEWNGMMKEILENRADLAITDLTITSDRERAVDFTMPFMNVGISILYKKPTKEAPSLFSFMSPFSKQVWFYLGTAYLGVSVLLFVMARISPKEWQNPYPCIQEPEQLENQFSMSNALWFTVGSVLQQGSELAPIAISTRMTAGIWWFFTLIMVSSYTANLAAFLTVESLTSPINNADDLANNKHGISYGAKAGGATFAFFGGADDLTFRKMYEFMDSHPEAMPKDNDDGINKVRNSDGKYAFLMESTSIEYITERKCDITQLGGLLDEKGYGIAMRKNSPYRGALSGAVLKLQETGFLTAMKRKWWKEKRGGGACLDSSGDGGTNALGITNVGGVFLVLICGGIGACFIAVGEMVMGVIRRSHQDKVPFRQEMIEELKFVVKCGVETKPVRQRNSESKSPDDRSERSASNKSKELLRPLKILHDDDKA